MNRGWIGSTIASIGVGLAGLVAGAWLCRQAPDPGLWRHRQERGLTIDTASLVHDQEWHFWQFDAFAPAEARWELSAGTGGPIEANVARVVVSRANPAVIGSIRLLRRTKAVAASGGLRVRLSARASAPRSITVRWTTVELAPRTLAPDQVVDLTTDWQEFEIVFPPTGAQQERAAVAILLAQASGTVELREVRCTFP